MSKIRDKIESLEDLDLFISYLKEKNEQSIILNNSSVETDSMIVTFDKKFQTKVFDRITNLYSDNPKKEFTSIEKNYTIILSDSDYKKALEHLNKYETFAYDVESTGVNVRKDIIIGYSFCGKIGEAYYLPIFKYNTETLKLEKVESTKDSWISEVLNILTKKELLMWNASFDVRITKNNLKVDLVNALLADIMLMKHTLEEEGEFSLKGVAKQYQGDIGLDIEKEANEEQIELKESITRNGGSATKSNYELYKADLEVIGKYACADVDLTLRLAELFSKRLSDEGLESLFYDEEVMPLYKTVTIVMEDRGIQLDMDLLTKTKEAIEIDINKLREEIMESLLSDERVKEYINNKIREEIPTSNKGAFAQAICRYFKADLPLTAAGKYSITAKSVEKLPNGELKSFLQTGDVRFIKDQELVDNIINTLYLEKNGSLVNIQSKQQMATIAFDVLGFEAQSTTDKGTAQFDDDAIQYLEAQGIKWAALLGDYNKLNKIKGTYIDTYIELQEDGFFYPNFFQHRTVSSRYGSNIQQLPRPKEKGELSPLVLKYNNIIRKFFIAGKGRKFIDDDYESLEPHVFAHVSGDQGLIDIFLKGHDFYSTIAIATEKLDEYSADKKADNYLGKLNKPKRQSAKSYSLGVPYGMKSYALGMTLGVSEEEAAKLIEGYLSAYPELRKWMQESERFVKKHGYIKTQTGRIRHLPKVKELYEKFGDDLLDHKKRSKYYKEYGKDQVLEWYKDYKNGLNNSKNVQIQGLSASIVNRAAIKINEKLKQEGIDGYVTLQIHDQIVINVEDSDKTKKALDIVQDIMENNYKLSLKLKAVPQLADNLLEGH